MWSVVVIAKSEDPTLCVYGLYTRF